MFSSKFEGTLMCNRVGHHDSPICVVCMKKGCQEPIPCCIKCVTNEHRNHLQKFIKISEVQRQWQDNQSLEYLNKVAQQCQSISEVCQLWKKEILRLIDHLRQKQQLSQNPTFTELSDYVRRVRERTPYRELTTVQKFEIELQQIQVRITNLQKEINLNPFKFTLAQQLKGHDQEVEFVSISYDDIYLASSYQNPNIVILWDLKSNEQLTQYEPEYSKISAYIFKRQYYQEWRGIIEIFDLTNLMNTEPKIRLEGHGASVYRITFTDDSNHLISVSSDYSLRVWDLKQQKEINQQNCKNNLAGMTYSHEKKLIACCGGKGLAYLFDCKNLNNLQLKLQWQAHSDYSECTEFIRYSTVLMTSSSKDTRFWRVGDLLRQNFCHYEIKDGGWTVKAYPLNNTQVIITCSSDWKFVNLWDYNSAELIQTLEIPERLTYYQSFAITSDFSKIITGGKNKMVNIFEKQ